MHRARTIVLSLALASLLQSPFIARAQTADAYPSRPVMMIVGVAAGGPIDVEGRLLGKKLTEAFGQNFLLDYKPGDGGSIAANYVAKAKPDGYTLFVAGATFTVLAAFRQQPYDIERDFAPISVTSQKTSFFVMSPSFPARNVKEYMAYAKANPGKINFAWVGPGVVAGAWLHSLAGTTVTFVPYKSIATIMTDLMAGRVDVSAAGFPVAMPLIKSGKVRALGVTSDKRSPLLPDVPTIMEQGFPEFSYQNWLAFFAPANTSPAVVRKLSQGLAAAAKSPDVVAALSGDGSTPWGSTPEELKALVAAELTRWQRIAKETGFKLEN